ncbi:MAG TPA: hypothetical protein VFT53_03570 [Candidatus Saccharimonadales bacterium]|nr:hypothetical protein [Candidatus Saccharimonadales bacterium]
MQLTDEQIASYQKLYKQTYGKSISKEEARLQALALLSLIKVLARREA